MRLSVQKLLTVWLVTVCAAFSAFGQNDLSVDMTTSGGSESLGTTGLTYTVTVNNEGGTSVTGVEVTTQLPAGATLTGNSTAAGTFTPGVGGAGTWTIGSISAGTGSVTLTLTVTASGEGVQAATAEITAMTEFDGDSDPTDNSVFEDDYASACFTVPYEYCQGETPNITANAPTGYSGYQWFRDGNPIAGATSDSYTITEFGNFSYTTDVGGTGGCEGGSCCDLEVTEIAPPTAGISDDSVADEISCNDSEVFMTATGGSTYVWSHGPTSDTTTVFAAGTYTVTVTASSGCTATSSLTINDNTTPPTAGITNNDGTTVLTCTQTAISVTATGGGTYAWDNGLGTNAGVSLTTAGTYTVTVTSANGCTATSSITITEDTTPPTASITNNSGTTELTCVQTSISLSAGTGVSYAWDNGLGTTPTVTVTSAGTYTVTVTGANGCSATASTTITGSCTIDYSDLPDASIVGAPVTYDVTNADSGPSHGVITGLSLGSSVDGESDGQPSADASGDGADDDGVTIGSTYDISPDGTIRIPVTVTNATGNTAYLVAWIDWNGDGDFDDPGEQVESLNDGSGPFPEYLEVSVPADAETGNNIGMIVRVSNTAITSPSGYLSSGEVESYMLDVTCPTEICLPIQSTKN